MENRYKQVNLLPDDWKRYKALRIEALENNSEAFGYGESVNEKWQVEKDIEDSVWQKNLESSSVSEILFVEEVTSRQLVGMIRIQVRPDQIEPKENAGYLRSFFVAPEHRGCGIGLHLLKEAERFCKIAHLKKIYLELVTNQTRTAHFYEKFGFRTFKYYTQGTVFYRTMFIDLK